MDRSEPKSAAPASAGPPAKAPSTGPGAATSAVAPSPAAATQRPWLLRKRSSTEVMRCPDLPTLRQWIVERRIARDDEISRSGQRWRRMGSVVELESLFYSAEQERAQNRRTGQYAPVPAVPTSGGAAPRLTPVPTPVATTPGSGAPGPRPTPVSTPIAPKAEARPAEVVEAKKSEPVTAKKPEPAPAKKPEPIEAKKPEPTPAKKPEAQPVSTPAAAASGEKKPPESGGVGTVKVTPPPGLAAAGGLSPMRLARKDPNRGKPQAMPGMAGSVQAAMRAAGTAPGKPTPAAASDAKRPDAAPARTATPAGTAIPRTPAASKPATGTSGASGAGKSGAAASGAQTAAFARGSQDASDSDDSDVTRKITPADARATDRQKARPRDAVEDAILRNDPVPRHLKEAAEGGENLRKAPKDTDSTEFVDPRERPTSRLRIAVLLLAVVAVGGGIWFYTQRGDNTTPPTTSDSTGPSSGGAPATHPNPGSVTPPPEPATAPPVPVAEPLNAGTGTAAPPGPEVAPTPAKPEPAKPVVTPEPTKPEVAKVEPAKPAAVKPEPVKPEPAKPVVATPTPAVNPPAATDPNAPAPKLTLDEVRKKIGEDIPKSFDDQMELAQRLVERYKYDSAQTLFEYMLTYASAVPAIHNGLGTCAFEKNRGDEAIQHFRDALTRRPSYSAAVFGLAKSYHHLKNDKEQALVYYKKYLELSPKGSAAAIARDAIAKLEGQPAAAPAPAPAPAPPAAPAP